MDLMIILVGMTLCEGRPEANDVQTLYANPTCATAQSMALRLR